MTTFQHSVEHVFSHFSSSLRSDLVLCLFRFYTKLFVELMGHARKTKSIFLRSTPSRQLDSCLHRQNDHKIVSSYLITDLIINVIIFFCSSIFHVPTYDTVSIGSHGRKESKLNATTSSISLCTKLYFNWQ